MGAMPYSAHLELDRAALCPECMGWQQLRRKASKIIRVGAGCERLSSNCGVSHESCTHRRSPSCSTGASSVANLALMVLWDGAAALSESLHDVDAVLVVLLAPHVSVLSFPGSIRPCDHRGPLAALRAPASSSAWMLWDIFT